MPVSADPPPGLKLIGRPANYRELGELISCSGDFERSWSEFLHEFYRYKSPVFFAEEPPPNMSSGFRAWLAGVAEYLSVEFSLQVPEWANRPEYFLQEEWNPGSELFPYADFLEYRDELRGRCEPVFLKRNVLFEARGLTIL
jgi:hypothetical protein